jgi:hypothetical protein
MVDIDVHENEFCIGQYWNQWELMDANDEEVWHHCDYLIVILEN